VLRRSAAPMSYGDLSGGIRLGVSITAMNATAGALQLEVSGREDAETRHWIMPEPRISTEPAIGVRVSTVR
jgi:hypothetical protein